jgi:hypothetical protein
MITEQNLEQFNSLYQKAKSEEKVSFMFEKQEVLVSYAKYVLEHFRNIQSEIDKLKSMTSLEKPESRLSTEQIVSFAKDKAGFIDLKPNNMVRLFSDADYAYYVFRCPTGELKIGSIIGSNYDPEMLPFFDDKPSIVIPLTNGTGLKLQKLEI